MDDVTSPDSLSHERPINDSGLVFLRLSIPTVNNRQMYKPFEIPAILNRIFYSGIPI